MKRPLPWAVLIPGLSIGFVLFGTTRANPPVGQMEDAGRALPPEASDTAPARTDDLDRPDDGQARG